MGITGEIVRNVFSKSRSVQRHESNGHHQANSNGVEKKRWSSSVRSYLCGDECNSVLAAEDSASFRCSTVDLASFRSNGATNTSTCRGADCITYSVEDTASVRSSEATVDQPQPQPQPREFKAENSAKGNTTFKLFQQEDAALIIQSAFRSFQARRSREGAKTVDNQPAPSPSRESIGTSIEVQTGNSSDIFSIKEDSFFNVHHGIRHRTRAQVLKIQEDWDDSTVSSVISKIRMQNRLEAATRRERALAYAFSQQLRLCSKRKQITAASDETNTGWSWLQRWMAARDPEITLEADNISGNHKITLVRKRVMDSSIEEKESCGSNEVSSLTGNLSVVPRNVPRAAKARSKATRSFSRQGSKVMINLNMEMKRKRAKQPGNKREIKNATANQESLEHEIEQ